MFCFLFFITIAAPVNAEENKIGVTFDFTYLSRWLTKGVSTYGQQGGFFETMTLDFWDSGFGAYFIHRQPLRGYSNRERLDYGVFYKGTAFKDTPYLTNYRFSWQYEHYPNIARNRFTTNEWQFAFSWPEIFGSGLIPKYILYYEYPAGSEYLNREVAGFLHVFGLNYDLKTPAILSDMPEQVLTLGADITFRNGLGSKVADEDWTHSTLSVKTNFKIADNLILTPGIYYQISMDDSVNPDDMFYTVINLRYKF